MLLRWIDRSRADARRELDFVADFGRVPIYIDNRLEPYFRQNRLVLTAKGFGPFKTLAIPADEAFSDFVDDVMERIWDKSL